MGVIKSFLAFVVVVVLTVSLVAGNAVVAVDRTAANEEFVTSTLEEEGAYGTIQSVAGEEAADQVNGTDIPVPLDTRKVVNDTLTRAYLRNQTEANVNRTFRYLENDTDELNVSVNLAPLKENIAAAVEDRIREQSVGELIDIIAESEDLSTEIADVPIDLRIVANMSEDAESYEEARQSFRDDIRSAVVERLANESYEESVDNEEYDPLLELVIEDYDPDEYTEEEKADLVEEREGEIKTELEAQVEEERGDEIDQQVDERLAESNEQVSESVAETVESSLEGGEYEPVAAPATEMLVVGVEGLTAENKSYEEFDSELSAAKDDLAANVSTVAKTRLDEQVDDRFNLLENEELSDREQADIRQTAADVKDGYGTFELVALLLPVLSLGLIGLLFLITRSVSTTALLSGVPMALVGGVTYGVATVAPAQIESQVESELSSGQVPDWAIDLLLGIVEQVLGVVASQSALVALLGVGLIVAGVVLRTRN